MSDLAYIGLALCECGHPASDHAEGYVCTAKLDTFPEGGWYGVCPCVRRDDDLNPAPMRGGEAA